MLVDLIYALRAGYRQNAVFVMNRKTQSAMRKFKDSSGNYLWQPPAAAGGKSSLIGFPVVEAEDMPDVAANSLSIAFGDFRRGYLIVDRQGVRVLRDPYHGKALRAVLHHQARRRRRAGLRRHQAAEVRGELSSGALHISSSWPGLTRPSITFAGLFRRVMDARVKPAHDAVNVWLPRTQDAGGYGSTITAPCRQPRCQAALARCRSCCFPKIGCCRNARRPGDCGAVERDVVVGQTYRARTLHTGTVLSDLRIIDNDLGTGIGLDARRGIAGEYRPGDHNGVAGRSSDSVSIVFRTDIVQDVGVGPCAPSAMPGPATPLMTVSLMNSLVSPPVRWSYIPWRNAFEMTHLRYRRLWQPGYRYRS